MLKILSHYEILLDTDLMWQTESQKSQTKSCKQQGLLHGGLQ